MPVINEELISREITLHDVLPLSFLKKSVYTGSKRGMRFRMEKAEEALRCSVWPEPFAFSETDKEKIVSADFSFSAEGISQSVQWMNERLPEYQEKKEGTDL